MSTENEGYPEIRIADVVTAYDVRLSRSDLGVLYLFLDRMLPVNAAMPKAEPGEPRQRLSDGELAQVAQIRSALFRVVHG